MWGGEGMWEGPFECFYVCQRVLREWGARGGGLYGYFREQGLPVGVQDCLNDITEDALTISAGSLFQNGTARLIGVAA